MEFPSEKYMHLKIFIKDEELKTFYIEVSEKHNQKIQSSPFPDAGFDLYTPPSLSPLEDNSLNAIRIQCTPEKVNKIDFQIQCSAHYVVPKENKCPISYPTGYYLYPRSSLSKTRLRLANSVGIIDSGYRGNIIGMFDVIQPKEGETYVEPYERLLQICAPGLEPIFVEIVDSVEELGEKTERGEGGFGSTFSTFSTFGKSGAKSSAKGTD